MADSDPFAQQLAVGMTLPQQTMYFAEYGAHAKRYNVAFWLAIFTGIFGGHKFYLGKTGQAILHLALTLFSLLTLGIILLIVDIVQLRQTVEKVNHQLALTYAAKAKHRLPEASA